MLTKILLAGKKYALTLATSYTLLLVIISFISLDDIEEINVDEGDKILHFIAYFFLPILWFIVYVEKVKWHKLKLIFSIALCAIIFGIIIELLQGSLTSYRATDMLDVVANTLGVIFASTVLYITNKNVKNKQ